MGSQALAAYSELKKIYVDKPEDLQGVMDNHRGWK